MWTFRKEDRRRLRHLVRPPRGDTGLVAYRSIDSLTKASYAVTHTHAVIEHVANVFGALKDAETRPARVRHHGRRCLPRSLSGGLGRRAEVLLSELAALTTDDPEHQARLAEAEPLVAAKLAELRRTVDMRRNEGFAATAKVVEEGAGKRYMDDLRRILGTMDKAERDALRRRAEEVESAANAARTTILFGTLLSLVFVTLAGVVLTRSLTTQIGAAVHHVQSSSAELQSVANQQASGAKESSTSMNEITTTISELLASSRQIADSAQRVASIAEQTGVAARTGDGTVVRANDSIAGIRRQVDQVVSHMLELGKKSQQIGQVLDIVSELAEQTNILAINATIEAVGAGESGKRFGAVADEIRKLADRVASATKEIRGLIDDVRSAVNTTVMATETGSKAVDAGHRQFSDVTTTFRQIAELIATTTDAAREIQLSTKQQATAVEQVNIAIASTAQAARETEASSGQTLLTASQLATLSRDLLRLVQPQTAA